MCLRIHFIEGEISIQSCLLTKRNAETIASSVCVNKGFDEECIARAVSEQCQSIHTACEGAATANASRLNNKCQGNHSMQYAHTAPKQTGREVLKYVFVNSVTVQR